LRASGCPGPGAHWLDTCAYAGAAASYLVDARISTDPSLAEGRGLAGPAMRENRTIVSNDFVAEARLAPWHAGARRFGFASVACVPLRRAGTAVAMLALYAAETGYFDPELVTLVERMAANVGHALDRLDAERRMRESEARFRNLAKLHAALSSANEAILRASSPAELLSRACEIAVAAGDFVLGTVFLFDQVSGRAQARGEERARRRPIR
jgi:transcriptional regulator with GAF, ATPase, and Fis domain